MDNLSYNYNPNTNQLHQITDGVVAATPADYNDIKTQAPNNYSYDAIGNLTSDISEGISNITWTVYQKIKAITKTNGAHIKYTYDASGNRISKIVTTATTGDSTYYVRDASGNVMSVYHKKGALALTQTELHLYGSSRLGVYNVNVDVQNCLHTTNLITIFTRGNKFFELCNHLANVLVTVSDRRLQITLNGIGTFYYLPEVVTAQDYYPFGSLMPGRKYSVARANYRYGFNGKENDNDVKGGGNQQDYGMRLYDPRLGKFLSVDPITKKYPMLTPYQFASNRPIDGIDQDGLEYIKPITEFTYNGTIESNPVENVPNAIGNGVIKILNVVPALWNSAVKNIEAIHNGTWKAGISNEVKQGVNNASAFVYNSINGLNTPIKQQVTNFADFLNNPNTLATGVSFAIPFGVSKLNSTGTFLKWKLVFPKLLM